MANSGCNYFLEAALWIIDCITIIQYILYYLKSLRKSLSILISDELIQKLCMFCVFEQNVLNLKVLKTFFQLLRITRYMLIFPSYVVAIVLSQLCREYFIAVSQFNLIILLIYYTSHFNWHRQNNKNYKYIGNILQFW